MLRGLHPQESEWENLEKITVRRSVHPSSAGFGARNTGHRRKRVPQPNDGIITNRATAFWNGLGFGVGGIAFTRSCPGLAVKVEVEVGFSLAFSLHFLSV